MKDQVVLVSLALLAIVVVAVVVVPPLVSSSSATFETDPGLPPDKPVSVKTIVDGFGVRKGDVLSYEIQVQYNPELVAEVDKTSVDKSVNWKPFEVRSTTEQEYDLNARTRVWVRRYQIQLVDGRVNNLYQFPTLVLRFKSKESGAFEEKSTSPAPVFVAARLPADPGALEVKPIQARLQNAGREHLAVALAALGGFLALISVVELGWKAIPQWREASRQRRTAEGIDLLSQAYSALRANAERGIDAQHLRHQIHHILKVVLARKEHIGWSDEPDFERVAPGVRADVSSLFETCTCPPAGPGALEMNVNDALAQLDRILKYYCGEGELRAWRR